MTGRAGGPAASPLFEGWRGRFPFSAVVSDWRIFRLLEDSKWVP